MFSEFNSRINLARKENLKNGVYDIHTNIIHFPEDMQPTFAHWEQIPPSDENGENAVKSETTEKAEADRDTENKSTIFPPLPSRVARNYMVTDTYFETPTSGISRYALEDPDPKTDFLASFKGLRMVSDEIKDLLNPDQRAAFDKALKIEEDYRAKVKGERESGCRREPIIDKAIVP